MKIDCITSVWGPITNTHAQTYRNVIINMRFVLSPMQLINQIVYFTIKNHTYGTLMALPETLYRLCINLMFSLVYERKIFLVLYTTSAKFIAL